MATVALRWAPRCLAAGVMVTVLAGCGGRGATDFTPVAHPLSVGAQPFALAEVARRVGLGRVVVADRGAVTLSAGSDRDPWLDPVAMERVTQLAAATLSAADPAGRSSYQAAARAYRAQLGALDIDYRSSLADCARHDIVTADSSFAPLAARYGFADHAASDSGSAALVHLVKALGIGVVFTEPGIPSGPVEAVAQQAHTKVDQLDTLTARTPEEVALGDTAISLMTDNLAKLRSALDCTSDSD